jgi:aspartate/methionine/tyrosine aminotransferase
VLPGAGTVVFPRLRGVADAGPFVEALARQFQTDVVPGRFFQAPAHFRLGFGGRAENLAEGLAQLEKALEALR